MDQAARAGQHHSESSPPETWFSRTGKRILPQCFPQRSYRKEERQKGRQKDKGRDEMGQKVKAQREIRVYVSAYNSNIEYTSGNL